MSNISKEKITKEHESLKDTAGTSGPKQLSLAESNDRIRVWDINDPRAHSIHRQIGEMIVIDCQPLSIVED